MKYDFVAWLQKWTKPGGGDRPEPLCNCVRCTTARTASRKIVAAQIIAAQVEDSNG